MIPAPPLCRYHGFTSPLVLHPHVPRNYGSSQSLVKPHSLSIHRARGIQESIRAYQKKQKAAKKNGRPERACRKRHSITVDFLEIKLETCLYTIHVTIVAILELTVTPDVLNTYINTGNRAPHQVGMD